MTMMAGALMLLLTISKDKYMTLHNSYSWFSCDIIIFKNKKINFSSKVLVSSDKRPYGNLTFHNLLYSTGFLFL